MVNWLDRRPLRGLSDLWGWGAALGGAALATGLTLPAADALFGVAFAAVALYLARTDLDRYELPDMGNVCMAALATCWNLASSADLGDALLRAAAAGGFLLAVRTAYRSLRNVEGLGMGDVKLAAAGALWLSWPLMPIALLVAALTGVLVAAIHAARTGETLTGDVALPLGAFLAPAIWLVWFCGLTGLL